MSPDRSARCSKTIGSYLLSPGVLLAFGQLAAGFFRATPSALSSTCPSNYFPARARSSGTWLVDGSPRRAAATTAIPERGCVPGRSNTAERLVEIRIARADRNEAFGNFTPAYLVVRQRLSLISSEAP
jgi:hypothetical protein